ncbi:MAG TPA: hypothetical protein VHK47_11435 [Polyangia bacterium]|nr:hypothetical protein [Polyangia bacterium]
MGHSLCMQPWVNLGGQNQTITQQAHEWVDLGRDLILSGIFFVHGNSPNEMKG